MAVRKLAPEEIQPKSFAFTPENEACAEQQIAKYPPGRQASAVISLLWRAQEQAAAGCPSRRSRPSRPCSTWRTIRVLEVATFYTMFNLEPVGEVLHPVLRHDALHAARRRRHQTGAASGASARPGHVSADGNFSWLEVECLGACCNAPMVQINDDYYEDLTPESFEKLLDDLAPAGRSKAGSQIGRQYLRAARRVNTLQDPSLYDGSVIGAWRKRFEEMP